MNLKESRLTDVGLYVFIGLLYGAFGCLIVIKHIIRLFKAKPPAPKRAATL